ncbi:transporter, MscS family [Synechococcus sp. PCC 7335]|uniref:mechanosensitive ion channel domain-containing protein n=1 Tax=Synechococcus sp. (strain ATCC 29403 / PCC 7335) TaxID=91464 RepID=UPI00017ECB15|nr:mechanosensitive ion channel domain-containing protein [Synechococcus sp. PCC 7335]EDX87503.1 transporter, MscS family [Synechococcus sp. PCC 7335]
MFNFFEQIQSVLDSPFFQLGNSALSLSAIAQFLLIVFITFIVSWGLRRFLSLRLLKHLGLRQGTRESVAAITAYTAGAIFCLAMLQTTGINIASLAVVAGSLGIGIGFGLQEITKNFISGLTLLVEQKLKVGDFIEIDDLLGHITEISLRSTIVRTINDRHIVVPNSDLVSNRIINWTYSNTKGWVSIPISVAHESDPLLVIEVLMDSAYLEETVSTEQTPEVYFTSIGPNSLDFKLWAWTDQIDQKFKVESSLNFIIRQNFRQHGIRFASPRIDVWNRNPNVVINSDPSDYPQHAELQQPRESNLDAFAKPVAVKDLLRQLPYFQNSTDLELRKLVEIGRRIRLEPMETIYREGDPGDAFYIILSGAVSYTFAKTQQTTTIKAGQFVGEFSLMLGIPRTVTVKANEETTMLRLSPQGFKKLLHDQPYLYNVIVEEMGRHEHELLQQGRQLSAMGLINPEEYNINPVNWVREHLERLFSS